MQWVPNSSLPTQTGRKGFGFSALVKLMSVPVYSPQCLNRATGHHLHSNYEQKHPALRACTHSGSDQEPAVRRERKCHWSWLCPGKGCSVTRERHAQGVCGSESHKLLNQGSRDCVHGSNRETSLVHNKLCPELPAWLPIAHFSPYNYRHLTPPV